jgi:hypothetical protein
MSSAEHSFDAIIGAVAELRNESLAISMWKHGDTDSNVLARIAYGRKERNT